MQRKRFTVITTVPGRAFPPHGTTTTAPTAGQAARTAIAAHRAELLAQGLVDEHAAARLTITVAKSRQHAPEPVRPTPVLAW